MLTNPPQNPRSIPIDSGGDDHHNAVEIDRAASSLANLAADALATSGWSGAVEVKVFIRNGRVTGFDGHIHIINKPLT